MCGIAAIVCANGGLARQVLARMTRCMTHRGPDDEGFEFIPLSGDPAGPTLGMGQRRLAIRDLSPMGHQPMVHPETGDVLIFNGEIYNVAELRADLVARGSRFRGHSDTEVLLHGLARDGDAYLERLAGMFALVQFERRTGRLLLARDPLGIKPLYLARVGGAWLVASEVRAILATGLVDGGIDRRGLAGFMAYGAVQEPLTFFEGVRAFAPGTYQWKTLGMDGVVTPGPVRRHWSYPAVDPSITEGDAVPRIASELDRSVKEHLLADVPVGVFLSSGIDSTVIAGLARRHSKDVRTFTVGFADHGDMGESEMAAATAKAMDVPHHDIQLTADRAESLVGPWLESLDQPSMDGLNTYVISKAVRDAGVIVALSGLGGDELFAGYVTFADVPRLHRVARSLAWMPPSLRAQVFRSLALSRPESVRSKVAEMGRAGPDLLRLYLYRRRANADARLRRLGFDAAALGLDPMFIDESAAREAGGDTSDAVAAVSRFESRFYMGNTLLRDADTNGMAHSLEIRVPMLDRRVLDLAYRIPGSVRQPDGVPRKHLLRQAFPDLLRPSLLAQRKRGFTLPIRRWMAGPMRPLCEDALAHVRGSGAVEGREVTKIWETFLRNPEHPVWSAAFLLVVLGSYLRRTEGERRQAAASRLTQPAPVAVPV